MIYVSIEYKAIEDVKTMDGSKSKKEMWNKSL